MQAEKRYGFGRGVDVAQEKANQAIHQNVPSWMRNGVMVENLKVASGKTVKAQHNLGRRMQGFIVMTPTGDATAVNDLVTTGSDEHSVTLSHVGAGVLRFNLWVW